ncbi:UNVERIFIED_CONTAM: hypothetical protein FKN15_042250 [Acipenser sinensis]
MPSRKHLSQKLLPQRTSVLDHLRSQMQQAQDIYFCTELRSSRDMRSFIGITGHFIMDYTLESVMLACWRFRSVHTADNVYRTYEEAIEVYNMADKVSGLVTDTAANMRFTMPRRKHLSQKLLPQRTSVLDHLRSQMQQAQDIYFCTELRSSRDMRSFIGITGHFIMDYTLESVMLACWRFRSVHTADNVYRTYEEAIEVYNMADKVSGLVTDTAANMVKAFTIFPPLNVQNGDEDQDEAVDIEVVSVSDKLDYFPPERSPCFTHSTARCS